MNTVRARVFGAVVTACALHITSAGQANSASLDWEVINPFRMYKKHDHFERHFAAFNKIVPPDAANPNAPRKSPTNIIQLMEQELNRPVCATAMTDQQCFELLRDQTARLQRLGWAAKVPASNFCYEATRRFGYRYPGKCDYGTIEKPDKENYISPEKHYVSVFISDAQTLRIAGRQCEWSEGPGTEPVVQDCKDRFTAKIPYPAGTTVAVKLPDGSLRSEPIKVKDVLVVGFGDSFASGEGNPDRPIDISGSWFMRYEGIHARGLPMRLTFDPRNQTADETQPLSQHEIDRDLKSEDPQLVNTYADRFYRASARWVSIDCHRSQYSYQFRAAMQIAVENRKRAVTLVHVACTGADIVNGLFRFKPARENPLLTKTVPSQLEQVLDLVCKGGRNPARLVQKTYRLPYPVSDGKLKFKEDDFHFYPCRNGLKRQIDVVLMSFGGNDVGFASLVGYSIMENAGAMAPVALLAEKLMNQKFIFGDEIARPYMNRLLEPRFARTREALRDLLGVAPNRVIQTSYEDIAVDEDGVPCGGKEGVNVNPSFAFQSARLEKLNTFSKEFLARLKCISEGGQGCSQPTGFIFVDSHQKQFERRGICAYSGADLNARYVPQVTGGKFLLWNPARFHPYASTQRLFRSPNDAFMTANTHLRRGVNGFGDRTNLGWAAVYSGAFHRNAEGHAIVADHVYQKIKALID